MSQIAQYNELFQNYLQQYELNNDPKSLYEPVKYILNIGGKRIRPVLTLMACDIFQKAPENALQAALSIELFHNFSLVHDDIMDDAPLRRGHQTVHEKWNINTGILSGDAMIILAYKALETYPAKTYKRLNKLFSKTALQVCEGQQWDVDFESQTTVSIKQYLKMITYKTAVLVGAAMKMGAIIAKTSDENAKLIYQFGKNIGIAFQIQDDYLDAFGDPISFGKQIGGDIIENKKTFLFLKAIEKANDDQKKALLTLFNQKNIENSEKIEQVKSIFLETKADLATQKAIEKYTKKAFKNLNAIQLDADKKEILIDFATQLMNRKV